MSKHNIKIKEAENMSESDNQENMVLRTVFLPPALDARVRAQASKAGISKGELIREVLERHIPLQHPAKPASP
jgi:hypothetical protein